MNFQKAIHKSICATTAIVISLTTAYSEENPQTSLKHWTDIGYKAASEGKPDEAIKAFQSALNIDPNDIYSLNSLGGLYTNKGELELAATLLTKAHKLSPTNPQTIKNLGNCYVRQRKCDEAIKLYESGTTLDPKDKDFWYGLGLANLLNPGGSPDETKAIEAFKKALELDPKDAFAWHSLGECYKVGICFDSDNRNKALEAFNHALKLGHTTAANDIKKVETMLSFKEEVEQDKINKPGHSKIQITPDKPNKP